MAKRRPSGDGMVRKRDDGRWEGRIVVGHKDNGESIFRYVYGRTQKELSEKLRQRIGVYEGAELTEQSRMTMNQWLDKWLSDIAATVRPNTLTRYHSYCKNHIRPNLGDKQISQIKPADIQKLYEKLARQGGVRKQAGLSSGTIRSIHSMLHEVLDAARREHLIAGNPTEEIPAPKFSYRKKQVLTDEQLDIFMTAIGEDEIWCDFFSVEMMTGLRRGEICGLQWEDFDETAGTLHVRRTVQREKGGGLTTGSTKTYAGTRKIILPPSTAALLRERKKSALTEWIFPNPLHPEQPVSPEYAYDHMREILKKAGLPPIQFHGLRHTFATHALASGVDVKTLSGILGHTRAAFTLDTYTHVTGDMQKRAANIVGDFMTDIFGEELEPWAENEKTGTFASAASGGCSEQKGVAAAPLAGRREAGTGMAMRQQEKDE
jgi:integrase